MLKASLALVLILESYSFILNSTKIPLHNVRLYQNSESNDKSNGANDTNPGIPNLPDLHQLQQALDSETQEMKRLKICEQDKFLYEILGKACDDEYEVLSHMGLIQKLPVETMSDAINRARYELRRPKEPGTILELSQYILKYIKSLFRKQPCSEPRDFSILAKNHHDKLVELGLNVRINEKYNLNTSKIELCSPSISDGVFLSNAAVLGYAGPKLYKQMEDLPTNILEKVLLVMNNIYKNPMLHSQHVLSQKELLYGWSKDSDGLVWKDYTTLWLAKKQSFIAFIRYYPREIFPTDIPSYLLLYELFNLGKERNTINTFYKFINSKKIIFTKLIPDNLLLKCAISGTLGSITGHFLKRFLNHLMGFSDFLSLIKFDFDILPFAIPAISILNTLKSNSNTSDTKYAQFEDLMALMEESLRVDMGKSDDLERIILNLRSKLPRLLKKLSLCHSDLITYTLLNMTNLQMLPGLQIGLISGRLLESQNMYKPLERSYLFTLLHLLRLVPICESMKIDPPDTELPVIEDQYHKSLPLPRDVYMPYVSRSADYLKIYANKRFEKARKECWNTLNMNLDVDSAFAHLADRLDTSKWFIFDFVTKSTKLAYITAITRDVYPIINYIYGKNTINNCVDYTHFSNILGIYKTEEKMGTDGPIKIPRDEKIHCTVCAILENGTDWSRINRKFLKFTPDLTSNNDENPIFSPPKLQFSDPIARWDRLASLYGLRPDAAKDSLLQAFREATLLKEFYLEFRNPPDIVHDLLQIPEELKPFITKFSNDGSVRSSNLPPALSRHLRLVLLGRAMGISDSDSLDWSRCLGYSAFRTDLTEIVESLFEDASIAPYKPTCIDDDSPPVESSSTPGHCNIRRLVLDPKAWTLEPFDLLDSDENFKANKIFPNLCSKIDKLIANHCPGKTMLLNTLVQAIRTRVLSLKKAMKASREMRDSYLSAQHINTLLNVRQALKLLSHHYDFSMRYRLKYALFANFHPYKQPNLSPVSSEDLKPVLTRDIDLDDPPPEPTLLELANRKYFREIQSIINTKVYHYDSKIPYFEQQKQLSKIKRGEPVENFNFDPDTIFLGRKKDKVPIYNIDSDDEVDEETSEKTYPLGFSKRVALDKLNKFPILSPSDEFQLAVSFSVLYPEHISRLPLVLKMLGNTDLLIRTEAAKSYLRKSVTTFSNYDLSKFNIPEYENLVKNQVYEECCLSFGGVDLTLHLENPAGCDDGIFQPWKQDISNRLEHYYAKNEPKNMDNLNKIADYLQISQTDRDLIHDKVFWRVYLNTPKPELALKLKISKNVTDLVNLELLYKKFYNIFCKCKESTKDAKSFVDSCHSMLDEMANSGLFPPKFSFSGTENSDFFQSYILSLIELDADFSRVEKLGNVLGYFGQSLIDSLRGIGTKMYLKYLRDHFGSKLESNPLEPLEKYNKLFHFSEDNLENIIKIHRTSLVSDEYSPESGWADLIKVKEIVEPGCVGEFFGLDATRSQQWLINILNEFVDSDAYSLADFVRFNDYKGLLGERAYDWRDGNALERNLASALDTLVMENEHLLDSALEVSIGSNEFIISCIDHAGRMNFAEAARALAAALRRLSFLSPGQTQDCKRYLGRVGSHAPLVSHSKYSSTF